MLKNYLITAIRNLMRNKFYSLINIVGLASGLACFILIFLYIQDELSYDKFHSKHERIYRVVGKLELDGQGENSSSCPFPVGPSIKNDYPDMVEHAVRFFNFQDPQHTLRYEEKKINERGIFVADSNVFEVFDYEFVKGNPKEALSKPNSIVLTEVLAKKYFGDDEPMGKTMKYDGATNVMVTGVIKEVPEQSHIHFDALISFSTLREIMGPNFGRNWVWNPNWTYLLFAPNVNPKDLEKHFPEFVQKYYPDFLKPQVTHYLQKLTDIHLTSKLDYEIEPNSDKPTLYIFAAVGIFILLIACINFMNLATARSANRAREVGVRKTVGAPRKRLITQFMLESLILSLIAIVFSLAISELIFPVFNSISGKNMEFNVFTNPILLFILVVTGICTGIVSGVYPAFYLSSFDPIKVLKGNLASGAGNSGLRKALVVIQFTISLVLITSTIIIYRQLNYLRKINLGFEKEQTLVIAVRPPMAKIFKSLETELLSLKNVKNVASMNDILGKKHNTHEYNLKGMEKGKWIYFPTLLVSETFVETMGMKILAGRNFSKEFPRDDSLSVIINEEMVKHIGLKTPEEAIGQQFFTPTGTERVIGVVKNFNFVSLHEPIAPFVLDVPHNLQRNYWTRFFVVRIEGGNTEQTIASIEEKWNGLTQEYPLEYFFLDEDLNKQYRSQQNLAKLITYFSALAIFIACLGLFALASYTSEQRTKEIGIRKVMGATTTSIIRLLSFDFLKLVLIANLIACPLSYLVMKFWLQNFAYKVTINFPPFIYAGLFAVLIAFLSISYQALKVALANPVIALKHE